MAVGTGLGEADKAPITIGASQIDHMDVFRYLGSHIDDTGRSSYDIGMRIAAASKAFGALREPVFTNPHLSTRTKHLVFGACVLSVLLYGSECWVPLQRDVRRLSAFYNGCIRSILGIRKSDVRSIRLTTADLLSLWGDERQIPTILLQRRLEWLGHVARMPEHRMPKTILFSMLRPRPPHLLDPANGGKIVCDQICNHSAHSGWYETAQSRPTWRA